jgi:hypothetical protein
MPSAHSQTSERVLRTFKQMHEDTGSPGLQVCAEPTESRSNFWMNKPKADICDKGSDDSVTALALHIDVSLGDKEAFLGKGCLLSIQRFISMR